MGVIGVGIIGGDLLSSQLVKSVIETLDDPGKVLDHLRKHVQECRDGDYSGAYCLASIHRLEICSPADFGTTEEELEHFRQQGLVIPACQYVEEARADDFENFETMLEWWNKGLINEDDLPVTEAELEALVGKTNEYVDRANLEKAKGVVAECREGNFENLTNLIVGFRIGVVSQDDLDLTDEELQEFTKRGSYEMMKEVAEQCRSGDLTGLPILELAVAGKAYDEDEIQALNLDLETWRQHYEELSSVS
ncbi:MAG: hypothetical protein U1E51_35430 [Candidatus Binatia bacterium]|nr:hypothetical protein [Candidatus Binatia bacterium]